MSMSRAKNTCGKFQRTRQEMPIVVDGLEWSHHQQDVLAISDMNRAKYPMPAVHFIGTIDSTENLMADFLSVTWAIVPGNDGWSLQKGSFYGETHISSVSANGSTVLNHPVDVQFNTSNMDGWPFIVCEVWDRSDEGVKGFRGCGCAWVPTGVCTSNIDISVWRPIENKFISGQNLSDYFLPGVPDLVNLREVTINPTARATIKAEAVGSVSVSMNTLVTRDFQSYGVDFK